MGRQILLTTLNSSYQHSAFGLRYIYANMGHLKNQTTIREFTINQNILAVAEEILQINPQILGLGIYIWNTEASLKLVEILKKIKPNLVIILGGPEISYENLNQPLTSLANFVICREADFAFPELCQQILSGQSPTEKILMPQLPEIEKIKLPYSEYTEEDIRHRYIYVEASRGCPYKCEYCLSSLDKSVRNFPIDSFLKELETLISRGARNFKFVDRTFNLNPRISTQILEFFLNRVDLNLFLHFEMVPDRLPDEIKAIIKKFPPQSLQFEIGVQTMNPKVAANVSRRQDYEKLKANLNFLNEETQIHTHIDLIAGLPGEDLISFARGFDELREMTPHEIQVGLLKRLKGTPIVRHDKEYDMIYQSHPPFQILATRDLQFSEIQKINRFAKFWDLFANSGQFRNSMDCLFSEEIRQLIAHGSYFFTFMKFVDFLSERHPNGFGISLQNQAESFFLFLKNYLPEAIIRNAVISDYCRNGKRDLPNFLKTNDTSVNYSKVSNASASFRRRQTQHQEILKS